MILDTSKDKCVLHILKILERKEATYSMLFRETKVSHITLQNSLKELTTKKFISKENEGYIITDKGKKLLGKLEELEEILK